ncbi:trehalose-phosphatase [Nocardia sp. NBC_01503]|uniref:trehalose-phosphatase n=1 Tax=Nocardia sp. NBC_01503 TaxID=2975997 RepID=UPI002E7B4586|nr:trehalose-phosphatase [Nocardia sp. NBC_01503]WTL30651.1 trehalose-phosphatase [Nocardia sp. NBC_01503]
MDESGIATVLIDSRRHDAVIFDMDGVVTDSAAVHAAAWRQLFDEFLAAREPHAGEDHTPFTSDDYLRWVDGEPRYRGVADFLAARSISLPPGAPSDAEDAGTMCALGNRKDRLFLDRLARQGVPAFESTVALVRRLQAAGVGVAIFSASRNCAQVLRAAGIGDLFPVRVDGIVAEELGLAGKPDPAMLLEAARRLGVPAERTVVVEDAEAGVAAGRAGGFGLVIGVNRADHADRLYTRGADVVVDDLARVRLRSGFRRMSEVPDALAAWARIGDLLDVGKSAVLLDFDGTLAEIVNDPGAATLVDGAADVLRRLARTCPVAIVSGRDLTDLRARVGVEGIWYAGCHGFELQAPDGTEQLHEVAPGAERVIADAAARLHDRLAKIDGIRVEHKRFAVAVHYRQVAPGRVAAVVGIVHELARETGLRVTGGRKVVELRPDIDWDKGTALRWILDRLGAPALPVYIGDDLTDEDGFDAVESDGLSIVVRHGEDGDRRTAARYSLAGPAAVRDLLGALTTLLRTETDSAASDSWVLAFDGYDPARERLREALCAVGNGYLGSRGAAPECAAGERHYPGTYVAGIYDRLTDRIAGRTVDNDSLVNLPNWLPITFRIEDGPWFELDTAELLSYRVEFDLRRAVLTRSLRFRDEAGRITAVRQRRFAAMHEPHLCALETSITAENWSGTLVFRSIVDTGVENSLVRRYSTLSSTHLEHVVVRELSPESVLAAVRTIGSAVPVAVAARSTLHRDDVKLRPATELVMRDRVIGHDHTVTLGSGETVQLEKVASIVTGRDHGVCGPEEAVRRGLAAAGDFAQLLAGHTAAWVHLWDRLRIDVDGGGRIPQVVRLHLLHLVQTLSPHTADLDVGVPARGLAGEAYRGHVFWDELFVFPVLNPRFPSVARALLHYRYRRLPEARRAAAADGLSGAMFPWQSSGDGREESQRMHLNPLSGHWNPDPSSRAHHIGSAIAYNTWQYYQTTGDIEFLTDYGAELLVEIARFWASSAEYEPDHDRYHLRGVIGPDEFHTGYPRAPLAGIDDNAYTNVMAVWTIRSACAALELLSPRTRAELLESLGVTPQERARWEHVGRRMFVPFHDGVISQFDGYEQLAELDWDGYGQHYGDIQRLDRILEAESDDINRYRAAKQADVLMLFYLLSADELRDVLGHLGYELPGEMIPHTIDYYLARTSHGSTLSALVHAWVLARANRAQAMDFFERVLDSDVADIQGGTTEEGIHLGAMAGSIDLVQRCFTGLEIRDNRLIFNPRWPESMGELGFPMFYRGHRLSVRIDATTLEVSADPGTADPIEVYCGGQTEELAAGGTVRMTLPPMRLTTASDPHPSAPAPAPRPDTR